jgi:hypothetical protein
MQSEFLLRPYGALNLRRWPICYQYSVPNGTIPHDEKLPQALAKCILASDVHNEAFRTAPVCRVNVAIGKMLIL